MASPAKNFSDPTGISALFSALPVPARAPLTIGLVSSKLLPNSFCRWALLRIGALARPLTAGTIPRIPTPPMGRQIVLTFPSIYKERGGGVYATGQLYPPPANRTGVMTDAEMHPPTTSGTAPEEVPAPTPPATPVVLPSSAVVSGSILTVTVDVASTESATVVYVADNGTMHTITPTWT